MWAGDGDEKHLEGRYRQLVQQVQQCAKAFSSGAEIRPQNEKQWQHQSQSINELSAMNKKGTHILLEQSMNNWCHAGNSRSGPGKNSLTQLLFLPGLFHFRGTSSIK